MRNIYLLLFATIATAFTTSFAQVTSYSRTSFTGQVYTSITSGTVINTSAQLSPGQTRNGDDGTVLFTLPFGFNYIGTNYTQVTFCTNGWIALGNYTAVSLTQSHSRLNLFSTTAPNHTIAPWFRDGNANFPAPNGNGRMVHGLVDTDVYAFEWQNAVGSGYSLSTSSNISFMVKLYGPASTHPGRIEFMYGNQTGTFSSGATVGIEDGIGGGGHYINAIDGSSNTQVTASAWPGAGNGYYLDPPAPCSGTPVGGTTTASATSICPNIPLSFDVTNGQVGSGLIYQWQSSTDNLLYTNIAGANNSTYSLPQGIAANTWFRRITSCGNDSAGSAPVQAEVKGANLCYCSPANGKTLHSATGPSIESVSIAGTSLNHTNAGVATGGYSQFSANGQATASLQQGANYNLVTTLSSSGTASVWIDWNRNGLFEAAEWSRAVSSGSGGSVTITVPVNASTGSTGMRIRSRSSGSSNTSTDACTSFGSGETEDYTITIIPAQPCTGVPNAGTVVAPAQACALTAFTLSSSGYTIASGLNFQWQSSLVGQNQWVNVPGGTSASASAMQAEPMDYRLLLTCDGNTSESNTVTIQMQTANCPAVNDEPCSAVSIPVSADGNCQNTIPGTTVAATTSTGLGYSNPVSCGITMSPKDVWYTITTNPSGPGSTELTVRLSKLVTSTLKSVNMVLFSVAGTCPTLTLTPVPNACREVNSGFTWNTINLFGTNLQPSTSYYLRVSPSSSFDASGDFELCAYIPPQPCTGAPVGGNTVSSAGQDMACAGKSFTLSVKNGTLATGMNYQWQRSTDGTNWSPVQSQTAESYFVSSGITSGVYYRRMTRCGNDSSHSVPVMVGIADPSGCYCSPSTGTTLHNTPTANAIQQVAINGTSLSNMHTITSPGGYTRFPATGNTTATLQLGGTYTLATNFSTASSGSVWIDWNRNGSFENSEWKQITLNGTVNSTIFTVPADAATGSVGIRIRTRNTGFTNGASDDCTTFGNGETEDYVISIIPAQPCNGTPATPTIAGVMQECAGKTFTLTATGFTTAAGIEYQWQSSVVGQNNWSNVAGGNHVVLQTSQVDAMDYRMVTTCSGSNTSSSNIITVGVLTTNCPPVNDEPCNATELIVSADTSCSNSLIGTTDRATASKGYGYSSSVGCGYSYNPKDVWYKVTTTASGQGSTSLVFKMSRPAGSTMTTATMTLFGMTGACPVPTLTYVQNACKNSPSSFPAFTMTAYNLTPSTTYYLRVTPCADYDPTGTFEICAYLPQPTPACITYVSPASNGVVPVGQQVVFEWTAASGATGYNRYLGTTNPPTLLRSTTATKDSTMFTSFNTKYYWYVAPKNAGGTTPGCVVDSFVTAGPGVNCVPLTSSSCNVGDAIKLFTLTGDNGTAINQSSGCSPNEYADYTASSFVSMYAGSAYTGSFWASDYKDYATIWIDFNDDGYFTTDERLLSNLRVMGTNAPTAFTINIPANAPTGSHRLRIRNVYYGSAPTKATDPCDNYTWGETEDYTVSINAVVSTARLVADGLQNACMPVGWLTVDSNTNNTNKFVSIIDHDGKVVAEVNANGNNLGILDINVYKHKGTVRQMNNGSYILDRNISIIPEYQPTTPVLVRLYFTEAELAALKAANPAIAGRQSLNVVMADMGCEAGGLVPGNGLLKMQSGNGSSGSNHYIEVSVDSLSTFFIHGGMAPLPVTMFDLEGERAGKVNRLHWTTLTEVNNKGFEVQRSPDGIRFGSLRFVVSKAKDNNSQSPIAYEYIDENPLPATNYYRLMQTDIDGKTTYSNVVAIKGDKTPQVVITNIYPIPAKDNLQLVILSPASLQVGITITDLAGRNIAEKKVNLVAGENQLPLEVTGFAAGTYFIRINCSSCEGVTGRFIKE